MKITINNSRRTAGILLTECLVYIVVFAILTGIASTAFYLCWDQSKALVYATDDIGAALRAGEHWRADVRNVTGKISVESTANGEQVRLPQNGRTIVYRFEAGEVRREIFNAQHSDPVLANVKTSKMSTEMRDGVSTCRWELELATRRSETQLPLLFTFEAAQAKP